MGGTRGNIKRHNHGKGFVGEGIVTIVLGQSILKESCKGYSKSFDTEYPRYTHLVGEKIRTNRCRLNFRVKF